MKSLPLVAPLLLAAACDTAVPAPPAPDLATVARTQPVTIDFQAKVAGKALACDQMYTGVGLGKEPIHPGDVRLYVHNVRLVTAAGAELPVTLTPDGNWQSATVALLDFTDNGGECSGDAATNTALKGTYLDGGAAITGLRFSVGVPFAENHLDMTKAQAPLNTSAMYWSWNSGYKFLVVEGKDHAGKAFLLHLGSSGCMKDANNVVTSCGQPNRPEVDLTGFAATGKKVVVDVGELLAGVNLDNEVACHSSPAQADCAPLLSRLGLPVAGMTPEKSKVFRIE